MAKTNDELMYELLKAKQKGEKIFYDTKITLASLSNKDPATPIENDHEWDLCGNEYMIRRRREYIVKIDNRDKNNPVVEYTDNHWTRSDFGKVELGEYMLMREVYPEEM